MMYGLTIPLMPPMPTGNLGNLLCDHDLAVAELELLLPGGPDYLQVVLLLQRILPVIQRVLADQELGAARVDDAVPSLRQLVTALAFVRLLYVLGDAVVASDRASGASDRASGGHVDEERGLHPVRLRVVAVAFARLAGLSLVLVRAAPSPVPLDAADLAPSAGDELLQVELPGNLVRAAVCGATGHRSVPVSSPQPVVL